MTIARVLVFILPLLACGHAAAQTEQSESPVKAIVFKCTGTDGSVAFSDAPCPDTQKMQRVDTSGALRTGSGGNQEQSAHSVADTDCRRSAQKSADATIGGKIEESNRHIADYQQHVNELALRKVPAPGGSGNLIDDPRASQAIATLNAALAKEREFQQQVQANATLVYQSAVNICDSAAAKRSQSH